MLEARSCSTTCCCCCCRRLTCWGSPLLSYRSASLRFRRDAWKNSKWKSVSSIWDERWWRKRERCKRLKVRSQNFHLHWNFTKHLSPFENWWNLHMYRCQLLCMKSSVPFRLNSWQSVFSFLFTIWMVSNCVFVYYAWLRNCVFVCLLICVFVYQAWYLNGIPLFLNSCQCGTPPNILITLNIAWMGSFKYSISQIFHRYFESLQWSIFQIFQKTCLRFGRLAQKIPHQKHPMLIQKLWMKMAKIKIHQYQLLQPKDFYCPPRIVHHEKKTQFHFEGD